LLLASLVSAGCGGPRVPPDPENVPDPALTPTGTPYGRFVGSEVCRPCHESEFAAWKGSRHHLTLTPVGGPSRPRLSAKAYDGGVSLEESPGLRARGAGHTGKEVVGDVAYLAGGRHREDLWIRLEDGRLQVFPVAFDIDAGRAVEPVREVGGGNEPDKNSLDYWTRFGRNADLGCYGCHATGARIAVTKPAGASWAVPRSEWAEAGVGCEACHGPCGPHVDAAREGRTAPTPARDLLGKGDAPTRVAACASCHGLRELLGSPFQNVPAQPGARPVWSFADPMPRLPQEAEFRIAGFDDLRPATYQQEAIALGQSPCNLRGGLDCGHCHETHSGAARPDSSDDRACLPCHREVVERAAAHMRHAPGTPGSRCIDCHMAPILRGPASKRARDHSLSPPRADAGGIPPACLTCHSDPGSEERVVRGWARFTSAGAESRRRRAIAAAMALAERRTPDAWTSLAALAGDLSEAWFVRLAAASRISSLGPPPVRNGKISDPLKVAARDSNPALRRAALRALAQCASPPEGGILKDLAADRDSSVALEAASAMGQLRVPGFSFLLDQLARRPDLAEGYRIPLILGRAAVVNREWIRAEALLHRALEIHPFVLPAINDLGIALANQGRFAEARAMWEQTLEVNPGFEAARLNLSATAENAR
jgi:hypothetical protein